MSPADPSGERAAGFPEAAADQLGIVCPLQAGVPVLELEPHRFEPRRPFLVEVDEEAGRFAPVVSRTQPR